MTDRYLWDKTGRTKRYVLRLLRDCDIAKINSKEIRTSDLIEHCRNRRSGGAGVVVARVQCHRGFQRERNKLGIEDLLYHYLRREGASRLFEKGYAIEEVAQVTGHRNLNILWQVYTQLNPSDLHR